MPRRSRHRAQCQPAYPSASAAMLPQPPVSATSRKVEPLASVETACKTADVVASATLDVEAKITASLPPWRKSGPPPNEPPPPGPSSAQAPSSPDTPPKRTTSQGSGASTATAGSISSSASTAPSDATSECQEDVVDEEVEGEVRLDAAIAVCALTRILAQLVMEGDQTRTKCRSAFHKERAPHMSLEDYLLRIRDYFECSEECYVLCLVYVDKMMKLHPDFILNSLCIHRLLLTCMVVAVKFQDDVYHANTYYAKVGGVGTASLNAMEADLVLRLDFRLAVSAEEYQQYLQLVCPPNQLEAEDLEPAEA